MVWGSGVPRGAGFRVQGLGLAIKPLLSLFGMEVSRHVL